MSRDVISHNRGETRSGFRVRMRGAGTQSACVCVCVAATRGDCVKVASDYTRFVVIRVLWFRQKRPLRWRIGTNGKQWTWWMCSFTLFANLMRIASCPEFWIVSNHKIMPFDFVKRNRSVGKLAWIVKNECEFDEYVHLRYSRISYE